MKYLIIGTAGHVDHGKTALIKALTGTDTDRLKEEQARGISIELGFASLQLNDKILVGIVDVPGHERFLKNMLAGTGGIDLAVLVVAADEGIMPQTREHLAMLQLYGVRHGVVAINKVDKVDQEWLAMVEEDIKDLLKGTFLADAPLCRVSAISGEGIAALKAKLTQLSEQLTPRDSEAPFRLWIDRVFAAKGFGVIVTGSVLTGQVSIRDMLQIYPTNDVARVRGLESHGVKVDTIYAGQRAAINLAEVKRERVDRGMALSALDHSQINDTWDVITEWHSEVKSGTRVRLHIGTGEHIGRLYSFKNAAPSYMRLILEAPLAAAIGDRGILRLYSPQYLIGGVRLVAPGQPSRTLGPARQSLADALRTNDTKQIIYRLLSEFRRPVSKAEILKLSGYLLEQQVVTILSELTAAGAIKVLDGYYLSSETLQELSDTLKSLLSDYHRDQPERGGAPLESVRQKMGLDEKSFNLLIAYWQQSEIITNNDSEIALPEYAAKHTDKKLSIRTQFEAVISPDELLTIDVELLSEKLQLTRDKAKKVYDLFTGDGTFVRISDMYLYNKTIEKVAGKLQLYFQQNQTINVAEFRDLLQTSRKVALPLLEYFDLHKYTIRNGSQRVIGSKLKNFNIYL